MEYLSNIHIDEKLYSEKLDVVEFDYKIENLISVRLIIQLFIGIVMLFWKYTIALGIYILIISLVFIFTRYIVRNKNIINNIKWKARKLRRIFEEPLQYGYNEYGLFLIGDNLYLKVSWKYLNHYKIKNNWIRVTVYGLPDFFFNIEELKADNVFEDLMLKIKQYCKEVK